MNEQELHNLKYNCSHDIWVQKDISIDGKILSVVQIANDDDPFYIQTFTTRDELERFISELRQAANKAWGEK